MLKRDIHFRKQLWQPWIHHLRRPLWLIFATLRLSEENLTDKLLLPSSNSCLIEAFRHRSNLYVSTPPSPGVNWFDPGPGPGHGNCVCNRVFKLLRILSWTSIARAILAAVVDQMQTIPAKLGPALGTCRRKKALALIGCPHIPTFAHDLQNMCLHPPAFSMLLEQLGHFFVFFWMTSRVASSSSIRSWIRVW